MSSSRSGDFLHDGHRLAFEEFGHGSRTVVLLHGLLLSRHMHRPLATALAEHGNHVVTLDLLGHGESDRPTGMGGYSMTAFATQVVALLDHLEIDEAVVTGTSLGANVALEVAALAPDRIAGMVIEMPVLDNALLACALAFTPLLAGLTVGAPLARLAGRVAGLVPAGLHVLIDVPRDAIRQDPRPSAAVLQGLFFGRIAPPREERRRIRTRTLVLGHRRDPIHPFSDADGLVRELPDARLVRAGSMLELRLRPERLTGEISRFVSECWTAPAKRARRGAARRRVTA